MCVQHTTLHKYLKWVAEVKMLEVYVKLTGVSVTHTHTHIWIIVASFGQLISLL